MSLFKLAGSWMGWGWPWHLQLNCQTKFPETKILFYVCAVEIKKTLLAAAAAASKPNGNSRRPEMRRLRN